MIASTTINYFAGLGISRFRDNKLSKAILGIAISLNLSFLLYYKYLDFIVRTLPFLRPYFGTSTASIILPIGISFYTFHSISYLIDVYRKRLQGERNPIDLGLYIAFFPQLVAGPIVRYSDIANQLHFRNETVELFFDGVIRFIRGLAKKVIIANTIGQLADSVFGLSISDIPTSMSWLGAICYALQIYYDFSGYSDMAIGLAKMFGFKFKENFNHPYIAESIQDFWRRWHISLSTWFRDYLYISLGGNQKGIKKTYINLIIVFFITGLWHGASWSFIVWGLFHGLFLILERSKIINLDKFPTILRHTYTLLVVVIAWVLFRSESLSFALKYIKVMAGFGSGANYLSLVSTNFYTVGIFICAILFCAPIRSWIASQIDLLTISSNFVLVGKYTLYFMLFLWTISELAQAGYNPFIYFRF